MGIFWTYSAQPQQAVVQSFQDALTKPPADDPVTLTREATERAAAAANVSAPAHLDYPRLITALGIVAVLLIGAVWTDAAHVGDSSNALFALATTAFGMVVGLLTGEKPRT